MPNTKKWIEPSVSDPLSEPTLNRRVWAAYLAEGYTRASWARALGVGYNLVSNWDGGSTGMSLAHFVKLHTLLAHRFTADQLLHGRRAMPAEQSLSIDDVRRVLDEIRATPAQCRALGEHESSPAGRMQRYTRTYVARFVQSYEAAVDAGASHASAMARAASDAETEQATVDAADAGRRPLSLELPPPPAAKPKPRKARRKVATVPRAKPKRRP